MRLNENFVRCKDFGEIMHGVSYTPNDLRDADDGVLILRACNIQDSALSFDDNVYVDANCVDNAKRLRKNDILICGTNGSLRLVGKSAVVPSDDCGAFGSFMLRLRVKGNAQFVQYQLSALTDRYRGLFSTVTINQLTATQLATMNFWWPDEVIQRRIVAYLDKQTVAIDSRVAVLEQKLAAYKRLKASVINRAVTRGLDPKAKMKDSGVDWIGKIPSGWEARNLTHCCHFFKGLAITKADLTETGTAVISYGQIHSKLNVGTHLKPELLRCVPEAIANADPGSRLKVGDIVFADTSEDVEGCGNCVLMDADVPVYAGYHAIVARPYEPNRSRYFSYLFNAPCWRSQVRSKVAGIKVFSITQRIFKGVSVLLPSASDANAIADYLDAECAKIDKMAELVTREIELYKKLKRSLINEVVTGKREVA